MNSLPLIIDTEQFPLLCCLMLFARKIFGMMEHGNSIKITFFQFFSQNVVPVGFDWGLFNDLWGASVSFKKLLQSWECNVVV